MAAKKKLVRRKPLPKFRLDDAMISELDPGAKHVIVIHADRNDISQGMLTQLQKTWEKSMGSSVAVVFAMSKDGVEIDIYEVKS